MQEAVYVAKINKETYIYMKNIAKKKRHVPVYTPAELITKKEKIYGISM